MNDSSTDLNVTPEGGAHESHDFSGDAGYNTLCEGENTFQTPKRSIISHNQKDTIDNVKQITRQGFKNKYKAPTVQKLFELWLQDTVKLNLETYKLFQCSFIMQT